MPPSSDKEDEVQVPWITQGLLENILRGEVPSSEVSVTGRDVEPAVGKGANYLSTLYRVRVLFKEVCSERVHTRHLIFKVLPAGQHMQTFVREADLFNHELKLYREVLPAMYRLQKTPGPASLTPRVFFTSRPDTLVLEDLRPQGFVMSDRRNRLDLPHCRLVVRSLARLHGLSAILFHREPTWLANLPPKLYEHNNRVNLANLYVPQLKGVIEQVKTWPGYERFAPKLQDILPDFVDRLIEAAKPVDGGFNVLNHGDFWISNILFKYSSTGEVVDTRFVDFQISQVSSPALDLQYFLCSTPQDEVKEQCWDQLLQEYHGALCDTVRGLDPDVQLLSLQQLREEMRRTTFFGFFTSLMILAAVVGDTNDLPDASKMTDEEAGHVNVYEHVQKCPEFRESYQKLLIVFEKAGMFG